MNLERLLEQCSHHEGGSRKIVPGETVPFDSSGKVFFRAPPYLNLHIEYDENLESARYTNKTGRIPHDSCAILPLHHGTGAPFGHSGAMFSILNTLTGAPTSKNSGFLKRLQSDPTYLRVASEAVDGPGHGAGPDLDKFSSLDKLVDWHAALYKDLQQFRLPIIPLVRSGGAGALLALSQKYPGLIQGQILMSPLHPVGVKHSTDYLEWAATLPSDHPEYVIIRRPAFNWINSMYQQMKEQRIWPESQYPFGNVPTLVLMGAQDPQISNESREKFISYALNSNNQSEAKQLASDKSQNRVLEKNNYTYIQVAEADHDVLKNRDSKSAAIALWVYSQLFRFIRDKVLAR